MKLNQYACNLCRAVLKTDDNNELIGAVSFKCNAYMGSYRGEGAYREGTMPPRFTTIERAEHADVHLCAACLAACGRVFAQHP
jgi:hypothetical protein